MTLSPRAGRRPPTEGSPAWSIHMRWPGAATLVLPCFRCLAACAAGLDSFDLEVPMRHVFQCLAVGVALGGASLPLTAAGLVGAAASPDDEGSAYVVVRGRARVKERLHLAIPVGNGPTGAGFGQRFAWVTNGIDASVSKISPHNNKVKETIPLNTAGFSVRAVTTRDAIWISECGIDSVVRINARTSRVEAIIPTGVCPFGMGVSKGDLFVSHADDRVVRIDPSTNTVVATIPFVSSPHPTTSASPSSRSPLALFGCRRPFPPLYASTRSRISWQRQSPGHAVHILAKSSPATRRFGPREVCSRTPFSGSAHDRTGSWPKSPRRWAARLPATAISTALCGSSATTRGRVSRCG